MQDELNCQKCGHGWELHNGPDYKCAAPMPKFQNCPCVEENPYGVDALSRKIQSLRDACRLQHPSGPGAHSKCICGASGGGSAACSGLREIRNLLEDTLKEAGALSRGRVYAIEQMIGLLK